MVTAVAFQGDVSRGSGIDEPIGIGGYMSSQNANKLKAMRQMSLKTVQVSKIGGAALKAIRTL